MIPTIGIMMFLLILITKKVRRVVMLQMIPLLTS